MRFKLWPMRVYSLFFIVPKILLSNVNSFIGHKKSYLFEDSKVTLHCVFIKVKTFIHLMYVWCGLGSLYLVREAIKFPRRSSVVWSRSTVVGKVKTQYFSKFLFLSKIMKTTINFETIKCLLCNQINYLKLWR